MVKDDQFDDDIDDLDLDSDGEIEMEDEVLEDGLQDGLLKRYQLGNLSARRRIEELMEEKRLLKTLDYDYPLAFD